MKKKKSDEWKSGVCGDCERFADNTCRSRKGLLCSWMKACRKFKKRKKPEKKIIELFGDAFHKPGKAKQKVPWRSTEVGRKRAFAKFGYKTLVIWASEVYSLIRSDKLHPRLLNKIRRFSCASLS